MAIELYRRCCAIFWLQHTVIRADKKGKAYSCELSYNSVLLIPNNFVYVNTPSYLVFYINNYNLFFKENLEHYVCKCFYNLLNRHWMFIWLVSKCVTFAVRPPSSVSTTKKIISFSITRNVLFFQIFLQNFLPKFLSKLTDLPGN